jgi:hypothetical protein
MACCSSSGFIGSGRTKSAKMLLDFQFSLRVCGAHVADSSEHRAFWSPGAVIAAEAPEDSAVGVGIAPVDSEAVVELDHDVERLVWGGFLGPSEADHPVQHVLPGGAHDSVVAERDAQFI